MPPAGSRLGEFWLRCLDAAITAPARQGRRGARPLQELLHTRRRFDRVAAAVNVVDRILPGTAATLARRLADPAPLALAATAIEVVDFGSGGTVFRVETAVGPHALKVFRRSLGRPLAEQRAVAAYYAERYRTVAGWYAALPGLVTPSAVVILPGPILGRPVAAVVQPFLEGRKLCFFDDLDAASAVALLGSDETLAEQFRAFATITLELWEKGERCLDLVGRENLMLLGSPGRQRLAIVDCGLFELPAERRRAPARYAALGERIRRLDALLAHLDARSP